MTLVKEFIYCKIDFALRATPATILTYYFSTRVIENDSVNFKFKPLLISFNCGAGIDGYSPKDSFGSVTLDNSYSNFNEQFRLSDLLKNYEIIGQQIEFYTAHNETDLTNNSSLIWQDRISSYSINVEAQTLSLSLKSSVLLNDKITYELDNTWIHPVEGSLGNPVPFVVGENIQVKPILMNTDGGVSITVRFAYATIFKNKFPVGGIKKILAKNDSGDYVEVKSVADYVTSNFYQWANDASGGYVALHDGEMASRINYDSANVYIATSLIVRVEGSSANIGRTIEGEIVARIYKRRNKTGKPQRQAIAEIRINKTDFSQSAWESTDEFLITFYFNNAIVMDHAFDYFVSLEVTNSPDGGRLRASTRNEAGRVIQFRNDPDRGNKNSWQSGTVTSGTTQETAHTFIMHFKGIEFKDFPDGVSYAESNANGLAPAMVYVLNSGDVPTDPENFKAQTLDFILEIDGIQDNAGAIAGGDYSGTLNAGNHILKLLTFEYDGTNWIDSGKFSNTHSNTHNETNNTGGGNYLRTLGGKTLGTITRSQLISDIARSLQCLITQVGNRKFGAFFFGQSVTPTQTITADKIKTFSFAATDQSAIITSATIFYEPIVNNDNKGLDLNTNKPPNFNKALTLKHDDGGDGETLLANTYALYGERELQNSNFNFLKSEASALNSLKVLLRRHDMPHAFIIFEIPEFYFSNGTYTALDVGEVFNIETPELPSEQGTTTYNNFNPESKTNTIDNFRANRYRCQIVQREYIKAVNKNFIVKYTARVILSTNDVT